MHIQLRHGQRGFGLVESLVALVVISVGMIGIASLYAQGLRASSTAFYRTQAVNLAADMADRIRVNRRGGASYGGAAANNPCGAGGGINCTPAQMAAHDLFVWQAQVIAQLPGGAGVVLFAGTSPPTYTIQLTWTEPGIGPVPPYQVAIRVPGM
jgi:type IV pilus assembly protein PilV